MSSVVSKLSFNYILSIAFAVLVSWLLHEFAHYCAGLALGYEMAMTLNTGYPVSGAYVKDSHYQLISAAGPLITLLEAIVVYLLMRKKQNSFLYPFLFTCFYLRLLATIISSFNPNDEARISNALGIGWLTLPLLVTSLLFYLLYKTAKRYDFTTKFNLLNLALITLFSSVIILSDQFFKFRLL